MLETKINNTIVKLVKSDLTAMETEAIVFYASPDLVLGSGFGSAISARGGASIQEELKQFGTITTGEVVVTSAGELNSNYIIHAVGPRFQEDDSEKKLEKTMQNVLKIAEEKNIRKIAFPPMGTGFYGISLQVCAQVMLDTIKKHIEKKSKIAEIRICVLDEREFKPFQEHWQEMKKEGGRIDE
jgi:O-acetyl-ADP-ribose deacetylase (regulator of RNase III)